MALSNLEPASSPATTKLVFLLPAPAVVPPASSIFALSFFSSRRRHTRCLSDWSSDVCSSDLSQGPNVADSPNCPDRCKTPRKRPSIKRGSWLCSDRRELFHSRIAAHVTGAPYSSGIGDGCRQVDGSRGAN